MSEAQMTLVEAIIAELQRQAEASRAKYTEVWRSEHLQVSILTYDADGNSDPARPFAEIDGHGIDLVALADAIEAHRKQAPSS